MTQITQQIAKFKRKSRILWCKKPVKKTFSVHMYSLYTHTKDVKYFETEFII